MMDFFATRFWAAKNMAATWNFWTAILWILLCWRLKLAAVDYD